MSWNVYVYLPRNVAHLVPGQSRMPRSFCRGLSVGVDQALQDLTRGKYQSDSQYTDRALHHHDAHCQPATGSVLDDGCRRDA